MKIGIIGLPQTGKKTLFTLLTNHVIQDRDAVPDRVVKSMAEIRDPRFDHLVTMYNPRSRVRARVDIELLPKLERESLSKGNLLADIGELDAICHVVRAFQDESVYHLEGSVKPERDIEMINTEMLLHDLIFIEKRLERLARELKNPKKREEGLKEEALMHKLKEHLEGELPLRLLELEEDEEKIIRSYPLITRKRMINCLNISEDDLRETALLEKLAEQYRAMEMAFMQVCAKTEAEISQLDSLEDRSMFLEELGIEEPAIDALTRLCIQALNLISFFTVGADEVRQWSLASGALAPRAAGVIHTDLERGFIRAAVMKYDDLFELGSEERVKKAGKYYVKGRDYPVEDGDIIDIRFNV